VHVTPFFHQLSCSYQVELCQVINYIDDLGKAYSQMVYQIKALTNVNSHNKSRHNHRQKRSLEGMSSAVRAT